MIPVISQLFGNIIKLSKFLIAIFILSFILIVSPEHINAASATEDIFPFSPGEKLTFKLKWGAIPAGDVVLEVLPMESKNKIDAYHFVMTVKSTPFIDVFYKVRQRVDSYVDLEMTHALRYEKKQKEGKEQVKKRPTCHNDKALPDRTHGK